MNKRSNSLFENNTLNFYSSATSQMFSNFTNTLGHTISNTLNTKSYSNKLLHVAVVGISGTEKEKGCLGVGKSCICNRFVRPKSDDYNYDHISVLSQTDFSGRIVNNDHWLYWGDVTKFNDYYYENNYYNNNSTLISNSSNYVNFSVIEHTEFIDDACFQPFNTGKTEPYLKRIQNLKLHSPEKLMYICKNQLGIEKEYTQHYLIDGKFYVDGFICCFDVSVIQGRTLDFALEQTAIILNCLMKTKKPIVVATTKNDEPNEIYVKEIERLLQRKEYRNYNIVLVETSSHKNINVDQAFFQLAQLIDKKIKCKPNLSFFEASRLRQEHMNLVFQAYQNLIENRFFDFNLSWFECSNWICSQPEYHQYTELFGIDNAKKLFELHVKNLKEQLLKQKLQIYLKILPHVLNILLGENFEEELHENNQLNIKNYKNDLDSLAMWNLAKMKIIEHPNFEEYFAINSSCPWYEADIIQKNDNPDDVMIPFDVLETPESENCFFEFRNTLKINLKRSEMKHQFKQLLEETGYITPGKSLNEVRVLFMGRECYENLSEQNIMDIYEEHQNSITEKAKLNFQELLFENENLFNQLASMKNIVTDDDICKINQQLSDDIRFKALDNLDQDRTLALLRHLSFIHNPVIENCFFYPNCIDVLIEQTIASISRKFCSTDKDPKLKECVFKEASIVLVGSNYLAEDLKFELKKINLKYEKKNFCLDLKFELVNGKNEFKDQHLLSKAFSTSSTNYGCFCIYSSSNSLDYIQKCIEKTKYLNKNENNLPCNGLPIIFLFSPNCNLSQEEIDYLREEGQMRAKIIQSIFLDVSNLQKNTESKFEEQLLKEALFALFEQMEQRAEFLKLYNQSAINPKEMHQKIALDINTKKNYPVIRILMCLFCGDIHTIEQVISPFINYSIKTNKPIQVTSTSSLTIEIFIKNSFKTVEFILTSYHGSQAYRDELLHGFFLIFSTIRKSSFEVLKSFTNNIPNTATQVFGVITDGNLLHLADPQLYFNEKLNNELIKKSCSFAKRINAHFALSNMLYELKGNSKNNIDIFESFFNEVFERKPQIEKAFEIDLNDQNSSLKKKSSSNDCLNKSYDLNNPKIPPPLPTRQESYILSEKYKNKDSKMGKKMFKDLSKSFDKDDYEDRDNDEEEEDLNQDLIDENLIINEIEEDEEDDCFYKKIPSNSFLKKIEDFRDLHKNKLQNSQLSPLLNSYNERMTTPSDDSEIYASIMNQNSENLLKPSQIKNYKLMQADLLHKNFLSCDSLDYPNSKEQIKKTKVLSIHSNQTSKNQIQNIVSPNYSSMNNYDNNSPEPLENKNINFLSRNNQVSNYNLTVSSCSSIGSENSNKNFKEQNENFLNEKNKFFQEKNEQVQKQKKSDLGINSRKYFTTERSRSLLDASSFGLKKHRYIIKQQQSVLDELKEKQNFKVTSKDFLLPVGHRKIFSKPNSPLSDEMSEEDNENIITELINLGSQSPPEPAPNLFENEPNYFSLGRFDRNKNLSKEKNIKKVKKPGKLNLKDFDNITNAVGRIKLSHKNLPMVASPETQEYDHYKDSTNDLTKVQSSSFAYKNELVDKSYDETNIFSESDGEFSSSNKLKDFSSQNFQKKKEQFSITELPSLPTVQDNILVDKSKFKKPKIKKNKIEIKKATKNKKSKKNSKEDKYLNDFGNSENNYIPVFMEKCVNFIESNGLDFEGLYRVPGNRSQVDFLFEKFSKDQHFSIKEADIPVNAVATALKEFVYKKLQSLIPKDFLEELSRISQDEDKKKKFTQLKVLIQKLPKPNYETLKFLFSHFVKVSNNSMYNNMDSKNLAICWWPTLLLFEFTDMLMFEQMRLHLEEVVQSFIDNYNFFFEL